MEKVMIEVRPDIIEFMHHRIKQDASEYMSYRQWSEMKEMTEYLVGCLDKAINGNSTVI